MNNKIAYKLSICIPTYNRASYLSSTLDSIILNQASDIEIVISDNASDDDTLHLIEPYLKKYNFIKYIQCKRNFGADLNYVNVVDHAAADYILMLGSDDLLVDDAISTILDLIKTDFDYYLFPRLHGESMSNAVVDYPLKYTSDKLINLSNEESLCDFFASCNNILGVFSFISNVVFKKKLWNDFAIPTNFIGSAYLHVYLHFMALKRSDKIILYYHHHPMVFSLAGNDSFFEDSAQRLLLDFDGYLYVSQLFKSIKTRNAICDIVNRPSPVNRLSFIIRALIINPQYLERFKLHFRFFKYKNAWVVYVIPFKLLNIFYKAYKL